MKRVWFCLQPKVSANGSSHGSNAAKNPARDFKVNSSVGVRTTQPKSLSSLNLNPKTLLWRIYLLQKKNRGMFWSWKNNFSTSVLCTDIIYLVSFFPKFSFRQLDSNIQSKSMKFILSFFFFVYFWIQINIQLRFNNFCYPFISKLDWGATEFVQWHEIARGLTRAGVYVLSVISFALFTSLSRIYLYSHL